MPYDRQGAIGARREAVRVRMLGGFSLSVGERAVGRDAWRLRKTASLVKVLALEPGRRMHRERAMDLLWPDLGARAQANNLRQTMHVARKALDPAGEGSRYLRLSGEQLALCPDGPLWTDVAAFEEAAAGARRSREPAAYRAAIGLYAGDLLPEDLYEAWAEEQREALRNTYLALLDGLAALHEERGEHESAVEAAAREVAADPLREEAHVRLMRLHALRGRRAEALGQYERLSEALSKGLGAGPPAAARSLRDEILAGRFPPSGQSDPSEAGPHQRPGREVRHNLPALRTSFVGRENELVEVGRALALTRLLTLTGPGGAGKTRLALALAGDLAGAYPDGTWLVELAPLSEETLVGQAVARSLGVRERPGRPIADTLAEVLKDKRTLLVLDNCEHLVDETARLVDALLDACPELRVLATSREVLSVPGEVSWPVGPLSLPDPAGGLTVEELSGYGSARLFVERARSRSPAFELTRENARAVADICRKLDGLPLAVELAAAKVGALSAAQISSRLSDSLGLLTGGSRTAQPRQRTIRGALDWSHDLLDEPEKRLFARLSVFAGGFSLEATEAVAAEPGDALDLLGRLVDRSLVAVGEGDGEARYRLLAPVRQYAKEKLEASGEAGETLRRHAGHYLDLVERAEPELTGSDRAAWLDRLEREHDNLRAALAWTLEDGGEGARAEMGLRLAAAAWYLWYTRGHLREGRGWLRAALSRDVPAAGPARARALHGAGYVAFARGEYEAAKGYLEESLALYRGLGVEEGVASCLKGLGVIAILLQRDLDTVSGLLEEAMRLRPRLKNQRVVANVLILAGLVAGFEGEWEKATAAYEESLALFRGAGDAQGVCVCLANLGLMALIREDLDGAIELLRENLRLGSEADDKTAIQYSLFGLAGVAADRGRPERAALLWAASETARETSGILLSPLARSATGYAARLDAARATLGVAPFARAWAAGKAMTQQSAIEYAMSETEPEGEPVAIEEGASDTPPPDLTRREREIADLVARGLTNRQIASELTISRRTADNHVANILKKLNLGSRAGVAARLRELSPRDRPRP